MDLHSRLLETLSALRGDVDGSEPLVAMYEALRSVIEMHRPVYDWNPGGVEFAACDVCGFGDDGYPCATVKVIASNLGIEVEP